MSVIEEAKKKILWMRTAGIRRTDETRLIEKLIKELKQQKAITEAAKFLLEVKRHKDTKPARYQASMPSAWRKLEEAMDNLG